MGIDALAEFQDRLYAQDRWAVLLIFQAMDAAGKDGAIKHVMSGVNPQGCQCNSFKAPTSEDLDHDYLWRCLATARTRPDRHLQPQLLRGDARRARPPELLTAQKIPPFARRQTDLEGALRGHRRLRALSRAQRRPHPEFFLHVFARRAEAPLSRALRNPEKNWKFSPNDAKERRSGRTTWTPTRTRSAHSRPRSAWYVVPGRPTRWFTRVVVAAAVIDAPRIVGSSIRR